MQSMMSKNKGIIEWYILQMLQLSESLSHYAYDIQGIRDKNKNLTENWKWLKKNNRGDFNIWTCELYSKQDNEHPSPLSRYDFSLQRLLHPHTHTHIHIKVCMSFFMKVSTNINI